MQTRNIVLAEVVETAQFSKFDLIRSLVAIEGSEVYYNLLPTRGSRTQQNSDVHRMLLRLEVNFNV